MSVQSVKHKPIVVGLTGGIASGKTTAVNYFKQFKLPVIDCDQIVKELWKTNKEMVHKAESLFEFTIEKEEDFKKIADIIFNQSKKREKLNHIVHPYVFKEIEHQKEKLLNEPLIIIDMPLLIEVKYMHHVDYVCLVYVDLETQIERLMKRDRLHKEDALKRIQSQMPLDQKRTYADYIFDNSNSQNYLYHQMDMFLGGILNEKQ